MSSQPHYPPPSGPPPGYGRRPFPVAVVAAAVAVLVVVAGVAYWLGGRGGGGSTATPTTPPVPATAAPSAAAPSATTGATPSASAPVAATASAATASAGAPQPGPTSGAPSPTVTSPTPTPAVTTAPPANPVPDFGYLHTVVTANGVTKITFDRAILLTGPAAESYAKAHHTEVTDDYMIQNDNPLIRTWTVSPDVVVTGSIQLSGTVESTPSTVAALAAFIAAHPNELLPVDLYYDKNDAVTKIAEKYFP